MLSLLLFDGGQESAAPPAATVTAVIGRFHGVNGDEAYHHRRPVRRRFQIREWLNFPILTNPVPAHG